jgi:hypothetical protein
MPPQHRGHLSVANLEARLQDHRRLPERRAAFRAVFRQFTLLCRELNLFGRELLAVDGTRIKAINNKDRNFTKNLLEKFIKAVDKLFSPRSWLCSISIRGSEAVSRFSLMVLVCLCYPGPRSRAGLGRVFTISTRARTN